jgi:hypothetical protein
MAGEQAFEGGFIERYMLPLLYPSALTRELQVALGLVALLANLSIYLLVLQRMRSTRS